MAKLIHIWLLSLGFIGLAGISSAIAADNNTTVANSAAQDLSFYSGCKTVVNSCGASVMIPTSSPQSQWDSIPYGFGSNSCVQMLPCFSGENGGTNVALARNGATASAYSGFNADTAIDGIRHSESIWVQATFSSAETINTVNLIGLGNNAEPTLASICVSCNRDFDVEYWDGTGWATVPGGKVRDNNKVWAQIIFPDITTDRVRVVMYGSTSPVYIVELEALRSSDATNVAASANGGSLSARIAVGTLANANNGDRTGAGFVNWSSMGYNSDYTRWNTRGGVQYTRIWRDNTVAMPDWLQVNFGASKTINQINLFLTPNLTSYPFAPTTAYSLATLATDMINTTGNLRGFTLEYWTGAAWAAIPNSEPSTTVSNNSRMWIEFKFPDISTDRIRLNATDSSDGYTRVSEIEALQSSDGQNIALTTAGATASASSTGPSQTVLKVIDGLRFTSTEWLQVTFSGTKTINEIDVFTTRGTAYFPSIPTPYTVATANYLTSYDVEYWTGTKWQLIPGGRVTNNKLVRRQFLFSPIATDRIRILTHTGNGRNHEIAEVEAWE
jgi:hypothetical protein